MASKNTGVYKISCEPSGKLYIGSAINIKARWASHRHLLRNGTHPNKHLQNAYNKHGQDQFCFEVVATCCAEDRIALEQEWIDSYQKCVLFNNSPTASTTDGFRHSQETVQLLRQKAKQRDNTHLAAHHFPKGTATFTGKTHTQEAKDKMRKAAMSRGTPKMAGWNVGMPMPESVKKKVSVTLAAKKVVYGDAYVARAVELRSKGLKCFEIAKELGTSVATAHRLFKMSRVSDAGR